MGVVTIKYDLKMDLQNYEGMYINREFPDYGRGDFDTAPNLWPSIKDKISKANQDQKLKIIRKYLLNTYPESKVIEISKNAINSYWSTIESAYFDKLYKYMGVKDKLRKIDVYITTIGMCPYNVELDYFFITFFDGIPSQARCIMHESMHLVFLHNYSEYLISKGLSKQDIFEINEALVELLNWEFREFLLLPVRNYKPTTGDLQNEVVACYKEKKTFKEILNRLIELRTGPEDPHNRHL